MREPILHCTASEAQLNAESAAANHGDHAVDQGGGQRQNIKAAPAERAAQAAVKRVPLEAKQAEAEARLGRPRKMAIRAFDPTTGKVGKASRLPQ